MFKNKAELEAKVRSLQSRLEGSDEAVRTAKSELKIQAKEHSIDFADQADRNDRTIKLNDRDTARKAEDLATTNCNKMEDVLRDHVRDMEVAKKDFDELLDRTSGQEEDLETLKGEVESLEARERAARKACRTAEDKLAEVVSKTAREQQALEHHLKIAMEQGEINLTKKELKIKEASSEKIQAIKDASAEKVAAVKDEYNDKWAKSQVERTADAAKTVAAVLERLPNVNVSAMMGNSLVEPPKSKND